MLSTEESENWSVVHVKYNGRPLIARINVLAKKKEALPYRLGIAVPFLTTTESGLPKGEENDLFFTIENKVEQTIEQEAGGILCAILTTNDMKEYMAYIPLENADSQIETLQKAYPAYSFQHYVKKDPDWSGFDELQEELSLNT